ncbi:NAD-dependent epimerase/dehydratase family protein [uncultured Pyramidobacter sp.]|uniref:NAD-dependent epimerase/dehydratase family protein n=1 Tax=uncultured Pyramidobacter sp. TaxID=1623495 RepID=UPI002585C513|nr:NAD-dependent epimerase/dehydratase family protein [uncultured Pyramidobacter sp.]
MKKIMVSGCLGQIGTELVTKLRHDYSAENVLATDIREDSAHVLPEGPFVILDARDGKKYAEQVEKFKPDTIYHLAGLLSATAEKKPQLAWDININGICNALECGRIYHSAVFFPSSIAAFGPDTPRDKTPQDTLQRPNTIYGVTKVASELLAEYYHKKWGVDTRGVRFPGLISYKTLPGGGTTDYAVDIYYQAVQQGKYTSYIARGTYMDMMYIPDAIDGMIQLMEADPSRLVHRCCFNITSMSFEPEQIAAAIRAHIPSFALDYAVDPVRQSIADSWPNSLDDSAARTEWDWNPKYDLESMTVDMLKNLRVKLGAAAKF